jgi:2-methylisocitrate lyase-like PEP mutase family enzyme
MAERQTNHAIRFRSLHMPGRPLTLVNAWDPGSARAVAGAGATAIATSSAAVALAHGLADGERLPFALAWANLARIAAAVDLPVSIDLERGYGEGAADVARPIAAVIEAGAIGCNIEDGMDDAGALRPVDEQAARLRAARAAADSALPGFFLNARTDLFLYSDPATHASLLEGAIARAGAYAAAGADGLFVPGLADPGLIGRLVAATALPVNVMVLGDDAVLPRLAALGVARISQGPGPYFAAMERLQQAARATLAAG